MDSAIYLNNCVYVSTAALYVSQVIVSAQCISSNAIVCITNNTCSSHYHIIYQCTILDDIII